MVCGPSAPGQQISSSVLILRVSAMTPYYQVNHCMRPRPIRARTYCRTLGTVGLPVLRTQPDTGIAQLRGRMRAPHLEGKLDRQIAVTALTVVWLMIPRGGIATGHDCTTGRRCSGITLMPCGSPLSQREFMPLFCTPSSASQRAWQQLAANHSESRSVPYTYRTLRLGGSTRVAAAWRSNNQDTRRPGLCNQNC